MEFQERRNVVNLCVKLRSHVSVVYLKVTTKAVARSHVRDCDSGTVRNFLEDDRHGVGRVGPSIQGHWRNKECDLMSWRESNTRTRSNIKAVCEIERTRSNIKAAEMRLVTAMKMKEAARAAEAVAIAEIKDVTRRRRTRKMLQEEIPEKIEETAQEIKSNRRTIEEGLETVNSAKMKAGEEETQWQWSERRRRSSSYKGKYKNRRETVLMDENGLDMMMNGDGTASSVTVLKPATSIGQILSRKVLLADESAMMMNGRVSLGQIL
ncbi:unnamed protein product [Brassica rapa]|uniref:Uncharacterized protein n=2 Tax=Brassica TaxID=3705 RepID=A0A8D9H5R9_BRACM|nr:unnamed protein product [Brassica napus]CAG7893463.1 unnamed protein product [Brassica rapa]